MPLPLLNLQGLPQAQSGLSSLLEGYGQGNALFDQMDRAKQEKFKRALENQMLGQKAATFPLEQALNRDLMEGNLGLLEEQVKKSQLERALSPQKLQLEMMKVNKLGDKELQYLLQFPEFVENYYERTLGKNIGKERSKKIADQARRGLLPSNLQALEVSTDVTSQFLDPETQKIMLDATKYAGSLAKGRLPFVKRGWDKIFNTDDYIKFEIAKNQIAPMLATQIKKLEQLGASEHQMEELKNIFLSAYNAPDPESARKMLQYAFDTIKKIEQANLRALGRDVGEEGEEGRKEELRRESHSKKSSKSEKVNITPEQIHSLMAPSTGPRSPLKFSSSLMEQMKRGGF